MVKLIQVVLFVTGVLLLGVAGLVHPAPSKPALGSIQAGVQYLNTFDKSRAQRQLDCAENQYCKDPTLLDGSQP